MITTPDSVEAEDKAVAEFYKAVAFEQVDGKLDAMALTQKEIEAAEAEENSNEPSAAP